jgi:dolichol-phosphate mannosyltransferase
MLESLDSVIPERHILVVPTYNCAEQVDKLFIGIVQQNRSWNQIWFIDNGSTDETVAVLHKCRRDARGIEQKIKIFVNTKNFGLGGTHKIAFEKARAGHAHTITILHGDNQAKAVDAVKALKQFQKSPRDFVLGSRFSGKTQLKGYSKIRITFNLTMNILLSLKLRRKIFDLGSGINVFPISEMKDLDSDTLPNDLTFNIEFLKWLVINNKKFQWCPIDWTDEGQISNVKVLKQLIKTVLLISLPFGKFGERLDLMPRTLEVTQK